jgi:hypothetical protein
MDENDSNDQEKDARLIACACRDSSATLLLV